MITRIETMDRPTEESAEQQSPIRGVGIVIVHAETGSILTIREKVDKPLTGRRAGQLSVPFETQKKGEGNRENVLGGLVEVFGDFDRYGAPAVPELARRLFTVDYPDFVSTQAPYDMTLADVPLSFHMAVMILTGTARLDTVPHDDTETTVLGWRSTEQLLQEPNMRPLARHGLQSLTNEGIIDDTLCAFRQGQLRCPVLQPDFSFSELYAFREQQQDMVT